MDNSTPQYGARVPERLQNPLAQWTEALAAFGRGLRVAVPGVVQSFDAAKQTVTVLPAIRETARVGGALKVIDPPPLLVDVPVLLPRGGGFVLTVPVAAGDECLVIFADSNIDAWFQSGGTQNAVDGRRHSLSDGFALLGPWSQPRVLPSYSTTTCQLRNQAGDVKIDLAANQITVTAQTVQVNATTAQVSASGTATVNGSTVNVTGSSAVNITGNGVTKIEGKTFLTHTHSGVAAGGGVSGPVV